MINLKNFLLAFFLLCCLNVTAQQVRISLNKSVVDESVLNKIRNSFTFQIEFFGDIFNEKDRLTTISAQIFETEKAFVKYSREKADYNPIRHHSVAFYDHNLKEMILHKEVDDLARVFSHEISHAILDYYCPDASTWLSEGLAELLEDVVLIDSSFYFDLGQVRKTKDAKYYLNEGRLISNTIFAKNFYKDSHANYTLSWAIMAYLYTSNPEIVKRIVQGNCKNGDDTFQSYYPGGIDLIELDVKSYFMNSIPVPSMD